MNKIKLCIASASVLLASMIPAQAGVITLDFEGVGDLQPVGSFYNGVGGPNYGITFGSNALGLVDSDAVGGGSGNTGLEPTPETTLLFLEGSAAVMNVPAGFTGGFSFFYSSVTEPGFVQVWTGLDGTGTLLDTLNLSPLGFGPGDPNGAYSNWAAVGVSFAGTAESVSFGGSANFIVFDNITLGDDVPGEVGGESNPVPEPSTVIGGLALGSLFAGRLVRRKKA